VIPAAVFDVDGTICFDGRTVEEPVLDALRSLRNRTRMVFASARPIRDLLPVLPPDLHDTTLVGGNGAFCRDRGDTQVLGIAHSDRLVIDELIDRHDLKVLLDGDWNYSFTGDEAHKIFRQLDAGRLARNVSREDIETYSKVVLFTTDERVVGALRATSLSLHIHPEEGIVDVSPSGVTKHATLGRLGIADREYVAFGNDANDELMLRHAGISVCVGEHAALRFADHHIGRSQVAEAIAGLLP
jgi:hydroxymethylpyrimidine pyrophosphatase-like HAD family hydrolase